MIVCFDLEAGSLVSDEGRLVKCLVATTRSIGEPTASERCLATSDAKWVWAALDTGVKVAKLRDSSADDKAMMTPVMVDSTTVNKGGYQDVDAAVDRI